MSEQTPGGAQTTQLTVPPNSPSPTGLRGKMRVPVAVALAAGALVAASVGVLERYMFVTPHGIPDFPLFFFSSTLYLKAWLTSAALVLAGGQLVWAAGMFGLFGISRASRFYQVVHRWSGRVAILLTLPVAFNCLFDLGNYALSNRVMIHVILGAFIYGIFIAKLLIIRNDRAPGWILPIAGSALFATILGLWYTSAYWLFSLYGWHL